MIQFNYEQDKGGIYIGTAFHMHEIILNALKKVLENIDFQKTPNNFIISIEEQIKLKDELVKVLKRFVVEFKGTENYKNSKSGRAKTVLGEALILDNIRNRLEANIWRTTNFIEFLNQCIDDNKLINTTIELA